MARNFRHAGHRVKVSIPSGSIVTSGKEARITHVLGIPLEHGIVGETVSFGVDGVWALTFLAAGSGTLGVGSYLFWDHALANLSLGRNSDDAPFGQVVEVLDSTNRVYAVRLLINPPVSPLYA